jgi:hypothetical protein
MMTRTLMTIILLVALALNLAPVHTLAAPPVAPGSQASPTRVPAVAIHVSELTRALETMPASPPTPTGPGTTGYEWWISAWHYFTVYESLKEALRSDGTPFVEASDADIIAGQLLNTDGSPRYPIVISLASEAIDNDEVAPLRDYVAAGGFLLVWSSAFTRNPNGTTRGNFALATEMGLTMANASLQNWYENTTFTKVTNHRLVTHIPSGTLAWHMPLTSEEIPLGVAPNHTVHMNHYAWRVISSGAEVIANGNAGPLLATRAYGSGRFIYYGALQPLIGHGGSDVGMYSYVIFRRAIEWAFEAADLPIVRLGPWRYPYDAAFVVRHDFENWPSAIDTIEASAQFEQSVGAKGDYYFCTGTLRAGSEDHQVSEQRKAELVASLQRAVSLYGATIGSHNGGLRNPNVSLPPEDYDYWHWGPDEALDTTPPGYANGYEYAHTSLLTSFLDIEGWFAGRDNGRPGCGATNTCPRTWVSPYFNSTREGSYELLEQLGSAIMGEQKLSPFPHWTLSTQTPDRRFSHLSLPTSEWYIGGDIAQSIEDGHTLSSVDALVDFYYNLGALLNLYSHQNSNDGSTVQRYITRSISKPYMWAANAVGVYDWWQVRSAVIVTPGYRESGLTSIASATIAGASDPETAVEVVIPNWAGGAGFNLQVFLDGAPADPADYRTTSYGVKVRVGAAVSNLEVHYAPTGTPTPSPTPTNTPVPGDNNGLSFDGSNDVVRAGQVLGTGPLTVEVWVQPAMNNANAILISGADSSNGWSLELNGGRLAFWLDTDQGWRYVQNSTQLQAGQWYHAAGTYANGSARAFVDGTGSGTANVGTLGQGTALDIGGVPGFPDSFFQGVLDEARISNVVRYSANFTPPTTPFTPDANTLALWHFDEGTGQVASDVSASANHGTLGNDAGADNADPAWVSGYPFPSNPPTPTITPTPTTPTITPTPTTPTITPTPTNTTTPTGTPAAPTSTPTPTNTTTPTPTGTPAPPTDTPTPTPTNTPTATPTDTPAPPTNTPTPTNTPVPGDNNGLSFDGSNDVVRAGQVLGTGPLTVEVWVQPAMNNANAILISGADSSNGWSLELNGGRLAFWLDTDQGWRYVQNSTQLQAGQWYHAAGTYANGSARAFVDGTGSGTANVGTLGQGTALDIGGVPGFPDSFFQGVLDEARISNVVRYSANFTPPTTPFTPDANTLALWHFDEGTGQVASDVSASANHGTLGNDAGADNADPAWVSGYPFPSNPPTPTITPTPTNTPLPNLIFADGFESGNTSAWSASQTDGGDLSVSPTAALVGANGLRAALDDNIVIFVTDDRPQAERRYRARFYFDPNSITMANGNAHDIFYGYTGTSTVVVRVGFRFSQRNYQVQAGLRDDGSIWTDTAWFTISDGPHWIEFDWRAATGLGTNDGALTFWVDGQQRANLANVNNDTRRIDRVRLGPVAGIDSGTRGTYYFDAFESRRQTYIGPETGAQINLPATQTQPPLKVYLPVVLKNVIVE